MKMKSVVFLAFIILLLAGCTTAPEKLPQGSGAVWQLVVIGDSSLWELGEAYASQIQKDVGVRVELTDLANEAGSAGEILATLKTGKSDNIRLDHLRDILKEAEVVVIFLNPEDSITPDHPLDLNGCFFDQPPRSCEPATFEKYTADLKAIWGEIFKLRQGKATILRATDLYNPLVSSWKEYGVFEACTKCWENMSNAAHLAAEAYHIPFLSRLAAFNGPNRGDDPRKKGYIVSDGEHPSKLMGQYTAELLAQMGYEPVTPP